MFMKQTHKILTVIMGIVILAGLGIVVFLNLKRPQEIRQKAAVPNGTETIVLSPSNTSYVVGSPIAITLEANLTNTPIDGFQIVADITGTVPSNLTFQVASISGVTCVRNLLTTTDTGKRLELACITQNPQIPFAALGLVKLGNITGKVLGEGAMTISYNTTLTKITKNKTAEDIVNIPQQTTYTFMTPRRPTPTPTRRPTPTPPRRPTPTPTRRPTPTPIRRH
jgi:hypothetical protein